MTTNPLFRFFAVLWSGRTWREVAYLALAFPLGLAYFILLTVGWSLGLGTLIVWIGFAVLTVTLLLARGAVELERQQASLLLGTTLPPARPPSERRETAWQWLVATVSSPVTWKGMLFLGLKFPLGLVSFVALVTLLALSGGLIAAPVATYAALHVDAGVFVTPTWPAAWLWSVVGLLLLTVSLWLFRAVAALYRWLAVGLLVGGAPAFDLANAPAEGPEALPSAVAA
jgi:hypothetical protein